MRLRRKLDVTPAIAGAALVVDALGLMTGDDRLLWAVLAPLLVAGLLVPMRSAVRARHVECARRDAAWVDPGTSLATKARLTDDLERFLAGRTAGAPALTLLVFDLIGFKKYNDSYASACGDALLRRLAGKLVAAVGDRGRVYRLRGAQFAVTSPLSPTELEQLCDGAAGALFEIGEGFMIRSAYGRVTVPDEAGDVSEALKLADQQVQAQRAMLRRHGVDETTVAPTHALAARVARSPHDVTALSVGVGRSLGLDDVTLETLESAAALRDVGMMSLPDAVVHAPSGLTDDEWRFVRLHTLVGERLLRSNFGMDAVAAVVRSSHERWDGSGYPDARSGADIPLASRIVFVCSAFQDMTAERAHRPGMTVAQALAELDRCAGTQFDPEVVAAFASVFARGPDAQDGAAHATGAR